jgi:hypothetical protein
MPLMLFSLLLLKLLSTRKIEVPTMFLAHCLTNIHSKNQRKTVLPYKSCTKTGLPELFVEWVNTIDQIFERVFADLDKETKDKLKKTVCYQRENC